MLLHLAFLTLLTLQPLPTVTARTVATAILTIPRPRIPNRELTPANHTPLDHRLKPISHDPHSSHADPASPASTQNTEPKKSNAYISSDDVGNPGKTLEPRASARKPPVRVQEARKFGFLLFGGVILWCFWLWVCLFLLFVPVLFLMVVCCFVCWVSVFLLFVSSCFVAVFLSWFLLFAGFFFCGVYCLGCWFCWFSGCGCGWFW